MSYPTSVEICNEVTYIFLSRRNREFAVSSSCPRCLPAIKYIHEKMEELNP